MKEIDFRAREALIKNKILYNENRNKGKLKITGGGNNYTIDLSKRLHSDLANVYVKNPNKITVDVLGLVYEGDLYFMHFNSKSDYLNDNF